MGDSMKVGTDPLVFGQNPVLFDSNWLLFCYLEIQVDCPSSIARSVPAVTWGSLLRHALAAMAELLEHPTEPRGFPCASGSHIGQLQA